MEKRRKLDKSMNYLAYEEVKQAQENTTQFVDLTFTDSIASTNANKRIRLESGTGTATFETVVINGNLSVAGDIVNSQFDSFVTGISPVVPTTTLPAGSSASASFQNLGGTYQLSVSLPQGPAGPAGPQGAPGESIVGPQGPAGPPGESIVGPQGPPGVDGEAVFQIGNVYGRGSFQDPDAQIRVIDGINYLDLWLVQGVQGEKGDRGPKGDDGSKGDKGDRGDTGPAGDSTAATAASIVAATAATAAAGSAAAASVSSSAAATSAAAAATSAAAAESSASTVAQRTQYMESGLLPDPYTKFSSSLKVTAGGLTTAFSVDPYTNKVEINGAVDVSGRIDCNDEVHATNGLFTANAHVGTVHADYITSNNDTTVEFQNTGETRFHGDVRLRGQEDLNPGASAVLFVDDIRPSTIPTVAADASIDIMGNVVRQNKITTTGVVCDAITGKTDAAQVSVLGATFSGTTDTVLATKEVESYFVSSNTLTATNFTVERDSSVLNQTVRLRAPTVVIGPAFAEGLGFSDLVVNGSITCTGPLSASNYFSQIGINQFDGIDQFL